jgi:hypothetical protein
MWLMQPLLRRLLDSLLAHGMYSEWQHGALHGTSTAAPIFYAQMALGSEHPCFLAPRQPSTTNSSSRARGSERRAPCQAMTSATCNGGCPWSIPGDLGVGSGASTRGGVPMNHSLGLEANPWAHPAPPRVGEDRGTGRWEEKKCSKPFISLLMVAWLCILMSLRPSTRRHMLPTRLSWPRTSCTLYLPPFSIPAKIGCSPTLPCGRAITCRPRGGWRGATLGSRSGNPLTHYGPPGGEGNGHPLTQTVYTPIHTRTPLHAHQHPP